MKFIFAFLASAMIGPFAFAEKAQIGYQLLEEGQDGPTKTYSATFEIWSQDRDADSFSVTAVTGDKGLEIKTPKKVWKAVKQGKHLSHTIAVRNATPETHPMSLTIERKVGKRVDTKTVSVLVPPQ